MTARFARFALKGNAEPSELLVDLLVGLPGTDVAPDRVEQREHTLPAVGRALRSESKRHRREYRPGARPVFQVSSHVDPEIEASG